MKEKLIELLRCSKIELERHQHKIDQLRQKCNFCLQHNFDFEAKIASIELKSFELAVISYKEIINELQKICHDSN